MRPSRRTFLVTGALGTAALAAGGLLQVRTAQPFSGHALGPAGRRIVAALVPAFLAGALPEEPAARRGAIDATLAGVDTAIAGLPPGTQTELAQFFALLAFAPARIAVAGLWLDWDEAPTTSVASALVRWQASRLSLLRSAYDGLHQLVLAAWYGNPLAWAAINYPGPPSVA